MAYVDEFMGVDLAARARERDPCRLHGGKEASAAAWQRLEPRAGTDKARILELIRGRREQGYTSTELEVPMGHGKNYFSGRLTSLRESGLIVERGHRGGCAVYVAREFA